MFGNYWLKLLSVTMNLRFTPTILALVFSINSARVRGRGDAILDTDPAGVHFDDSKLDNEKYTIHRLTNTIPLPILNKEYQVDAVSTILMWVFSKVERVVLTYS